MDIRQVQTDIHIQIQNFKLQELRQVKVRSTECHLFLDCSVSWPRSHGKKSFFLKCKLELTSEFYNAEELRVFNMCYDTLNV